MTKAAKTKTPAKSAVEKVEAARPELPQLFHWGDWLSRLADSGMKLEERDEDGTHLVRAEMPGIDPDKDVHIEVDHGVLTIQAERRQQARSENEHGYHSEFHYGSFARSVQLPAGATEDDVKATYRDGILEIRFPVDREQAEARKIPVTRG